MATIVATDAHSRQTSGNRVVVMSDIALSGRFGPILPALALFVGGYLGFRRLDSHFGMRLDHSLIRRASVVSGVGMWCVSILLYSYMVFQAPSDFGFELHQLWIFSPIVSFAPGIGALVMTLCSGELAAMLSDDSPVSKMVTRGDPFVRDDENCIPCGPID